MANYPFKINVVSKNGTQTSHYTASFATGTDIAISASIMVDRINAIPVATSYTEDEEAPTLHGSKTFRSGGSGNTSSGIISASFTEPNTGSVVFTDTEAGTAGGLDYYTFYGSKVCSVLGLPEGMPIYTENFKFSDSSTDKINYMSGQVISDSVQIKEGFKLSSQARVKSNLIWDDAFGEGYVQWVSGSTTKQFMGYDPVKDLYNIGTSQITASSATINTLKSTTVNVSTINNRAIKSTDGTFQFNGDNNNVSYTFNGSGGGEFLLRLIPSAEGSIHGAHFDTDIFIPTTKKLMFDSVGGSTYIQESSNDILDFYVGGDNMLKIDEGNNAITMPQQPCFHVHKSTAQTPGVSTTDTQVTFDTERTDAGGNFASNTFTAPVDGTYLFQATLDVRTIPATTDYLWCKIVTSNETYFGDIFRIDDFANSEVDYFSFSCTAIADMDASDTAIVKIQSANAGTGWKVHGVSGQPHSFFQGYLIG